MLDMVRINGDNNFMCKRCYDRNRKVPDSRIDKDVFAQKFAPIKEKFKAELAQDATRSDENEGQNGGKQGRTDSPQQTSSKSPSMQVDQQKKRKKSEDQPSQQSNKRGRPPFALRSKDDISINKKQRKDMESGKSKSVDARHKKHSSRTEQPEIKKVKQSQSGQKKGKELDSTRASPSPAQIYREIWEQVEREEKEKRMNKDKKPGLSPPVVERAERAEKTQNDENDDPTSTTRSVPGRAAKNHKNQDTDSESDVETTAKPKQKPSPRSLGRPRTPVGEEASTPRSGNPRDMSQRELRIELKKLGLSPSGLREELVERLIAAREGRTPTKLGKVKELFSGRKSTGGTKRPRVETVTDGTEIIEISEEREETPMKKAKTHSKNSRPPANFVIQASPNPPSPNSRIPTSSRRQDTGKPKVILGLSGSVAAIKALSLVQQISQFADVRIVSTEKATNFYNVQELEAFVDVFTDADEWTIWKRISDPVQHIELRKWADLMIIAPLSANTLAKLANGLCDNLLTSIARAWDFGKPLLVAPAMNTFMFRHPFTEKHVKTLEDIGIEVVKPVSKKLTGGDIGTGAMADTSVIISAVKKALKVEDVLPSISMMSTSGAVSTSAIPSSNSMLNFPLTSHLVQPPVLHSSQSPPTNGEAVPSTNQNGRPALPGLQPIIHNFLTYVPTTRT